MPCRRRRRAKRRRRDPMSDIMGITSDPSRALVGLGIASASYKLVKNLNK